jgi:hypothetical protein
MTECQKILQLQVGAKEPDSVHSCGRYNRSYWAPSLLDNNSC